MSLSSSRRLRSSLFSLLALGLLASVPTAQRRSVGTTVDRGITISIHGIPLTLISKQAPAGKEIALCASSLGHASGNATGIKVDSRSANSSTGNSSTAIDAVAFASTDGQADGVALGARLDAQALGSFGSPMLPFRDGIATGCEVIATATGNVDTAQATGISVRASSSTLTGSASTTGIDVVADANAAVNGTTGIRVRASGDFGTGLDVIGSSDTVNGIGIRARGDTLAPGQGIGIDATGTAVGFGSMAIGVQGTGATWGVRSIGNLAATGTKAFLQPHPHDAATMIQFFSLEGNESGTYFRGQARLIGGVAEIPIPEEWTLVSDPAGITVQLTALGGPARLWVETKSRERIVVRGDLDCDFDYFVNGVRRGFASYEPYRRNTAFVPAVRGVPFGHEYPEELRNVMVGSGLLNADYTPNETLAAALDWELEDPEEATPAPGSVIERTGPAPGKKRR